jgi:hypothetical protein
MASSMDARWSGLAANPLPVSCTARSSSCFRRSVSAASEAVAAAAAARRGCLLR